MTHPFLNIALFVATDDEAMMTVAHKVGASIKNGGRTIYNGNDETTPVPTIYEMTDFYESFAGKEQTFAGWTSMERVKMLDFGKCGEELRDRMLNEHFDPSTVRLLNQNSDEFLQPDSVAIHVDMTNKGTWFEHIITKTQPPLDLDDE